MNIKKNTDKLIYGLRVLKLPMRMVMEEAVDEFENYLKEIKFSPFASCNAYDSYLENKDAFHENKEEKIILYRSDPMFAYWAMNMLIHKYSDFDYINNAIKHNPDYEKNYLKLKKQAISQIAKNYEEFRLIASETDMWLEQPTCFIWRVFEGKRCPVECFCLYREDDDEIFYEDFI